MFTEYLREHPLQEEQICSKETFHPFPRPGEQPLRELIGEKHTKLAIQRAEHYLNHVWEVLPAIRYMDFARNGDRSRYQEPYARRRNALLALLEGEMLEDQGRFLDDIINGVWAVCEETSWVVPAHNNNQEKEWIDPLPIAEKLPYIDLFSAETAALLAWVYYFLKERLDRQSRAVCRRIELEVERRIIEPYLYTYDSFWMQITNPNEIANNWNPWIHMNCLTAVFILEPDMLRRSHAVRRALVSMDRFLASYGEDGCCDEGPSYWGAAGGAMFDALELLYHASDGCLDFFGEPKIRAMCAYCRKVYLGNAYYVNFADSPPQLDFENACLLYRWGSRCGEEESRRFGIWLFQQSEQTSFFAGQFVKKIYHSLFFYRRIYSLFDLPALLKEEKAKPPRLGTHWFPDKEVLVSTAQPEGNAPFTLAAKGGHNGESHNHNDVGTFLLYRGGNPVVIDIGSGAYTAKTFSPRRYELVNNASAYHCCPIINGVEQGSGTACRSAFASFAEQGSRVIFRLDLASAYPAEAGVQKWERCFELDRQKNELKVTESYRLQEAVELQLPLMTAAEPQPMGEGRLRLGLEGASVVLCYPAREVSVRWEKLEDTEPPIETTGWKGFGIWRVLLRLIHPTPEGMVSYRFLALDEG